MTTHTKSISLLVGVALLLFGCPSDSRGQWTYFDNNADIRVLYQRGDSLWVGTNGGLLFVDLLSDKVTGKITAGESLAGTSVRVIEGHNGLVYVGTDNGLSIFGPDGVAVHTPRESDIFADIRSVSFGPTDAMHLGTFGYGVGVIDDEEGITRITKADSLLDNIVFGVSVVDTGRTYYATALGLCAYRDSAWVGFQAGAGLPRGQVRQMCHVGVDRFYLLIAGRGIYRFNERRAIRIRSRDTFDGGEIAAIALDGDKRLWAAGRLGGIGSYYKGTWTRYGDDDPDITEGRWRTVYAAPDGTVYFGSSDGLIAIVAEGKLRKIKIPSTLPDGYVGVIVQDATGRRYIVNGPYLLSSDTGVGEFSLEAHIGAVFAIALSPEGEAWMSTPWGLLRREGSEWLEVEPNIEPVAPIFVSIAFDPSGNLWAGGHEGDVYRFDGEFWIRFTERHELSSGPISSIAIDHRRNVWVVSRKERLHRYDGLRWETFDETETGEGRILSVTTTPNGEPLVLTETHIWLYRPGLGFRSIESPSTLDIGHYGAVCFDTDGRLYLGAAGGVAVFENGPASWLTSRDGLRGRDVTTMMVDDGGYLWIGFQKDGISKIASQDLRDIE